MKHEVPSLETICYESIARSITSAPPFLQEQIYRISKDSYMKNIRKEIKDELKRELREELKVELLEELLDNYLYTLPGLVEEASSLMINYNYDEKDVESLLRNSLNTEPEISNLAALCASSAYEKMKERTYYERNNSIYDLYNLDYE